MTHALKGAKTTLYNFVKLNYHICIAMTHMHSSQDPSPLSETVHDMALHVHDQARMLLMDISKGTQASSLENRLGCIAGAVHQLESLLESYQRMDASQAIHLPNLEAPICNRCDFKNR